MPQNIALVALDVNVQHPKFDDYNDLNAHEKIDLITMHIEEICEQLAKKEPNSTWIISWHEYSITDPNSKFINNDERHYFKEAMEEITKKYPNLTIISGAMATEKSFSNTKFKEKYAGIRNYYNHPFLKQHLTKQSHTHREAVLALNDHLEKVEEVNVVRNTIYGFSQGVCNFRHDKITPFWETAKNKDWIENVATSDEVEANTIFQPGNKKTADYNSNLYTIHGPKGETIDIGVEICLEHKSGILKYELLSKDTKPLIHIVSSAGMGVNLENISADYFVLLDYNIKPRLVVKNMNLDELKDLPVHLYQHNLLNPQAQLMGPLKPCFPFEVIAIKQFDDFKNLIIQSDMANKSKLLPFIDNCKADLINIIGEGQSRDGYLASNIQKLKEMLKNTDFVNPKTAAEAVAVKLHEVMVELIFSSTNFDITDSPLIEARAGDFQMTDDLKTNIISMIEKYSTKIINITECAPNDLFNYPIKAANPLLLEAKLMMAENLKGGIEKTSSADEVLKILQDFAEIDSRLDNIYHKSSNLKSDIGIIKTLNKIEDSIMVAKNAISTVYKI